MTMSKTTILLADDHALLRMGLSSLLECQPDMTVIGEAEDGEEAIRLARKLSPDLVIMDLAMPVMNGAEATKKIIESCPSTRIFVLTSFPESIELARALASGASGALVKDTPNDKLLAALRKVIAGQRVIPPEMQRQINEVIAFASLSDRQLAFLELAARGFSNEDIVRQHKTTIDAVKKQFSAIFQKLGVTNRAEAVAYAQRKHLLKA